MKQESAVHSNKKSRSKRFLRWMLIRLPFVIIIALVLMSVTFKLVERYPEELRAGFEQVMSSSTNTNASIQKLEKITFIFEFNLIIKNLTMHNRDNAAIIDMEVEHIEVSAPFWSMLFGGSRVNNLYINGWKSSAGLLFPKAVYLSEVKIIDKEGPDQYGSFLVADGQYDGKKLNVEMKIKKLKKGYKILKSFPFYIRLGESEIAASLVKGFSEVWLEKVVFSKTGKVSSPHNYILSEGGAYNKDNPLSCLLYHGDSIKCDIYLEEKGNL